MQCDDHEDVIPDLDDPDMARKFFIISGKNLTARLLVSCTLITIIQLAPTAYRGGVVYAGWLSLL